MGAVGEGKYSWNKDTAFSLSPALGFIIIITIDFRGRLLDLGRPRRNENHQARKWHRGKLPADPTQEKQMKIRVGDGPIGHKGMQLSLSNQL